MLKKETLKLSKNIPNLDSWFYNNIKGKKE